MIIDAGWAAHPPPEESGQGGAHDSFGGDTQCSMRQAPELMSAQIQGSIHVAHSKSSWLSLLWMFEARGFLESVELG